MDTPDGIPGSVLTGPYPVGDYAAALRDRLRGFTRVQVFGEVFGFKAGRAKVWFELRDAGRRAAVLDVARGLRQAAARAAGRRRAGRRRGRVRLLPRLAHRVARVLVLGHAAAGRRRGRPAGPARAAAAAAARRGAVRAAEGAAAAAAAALHRRRDRASRARRATTSWPACAAAAGRGRLVWGFAPVQDRHAAPAITRALQDLAACEEVEVIVVARGGGSLADLFAFCDETLCRTVALLRVPVISSVGHHTDRTLLDDVAAVACSTPTHAAETAVPVDCTAARAALARRRRAGSSARAAAPCSTAPARSPASRARPAHHVARHRTRLHQHLRELRAATRRAVAAGERTTLLTRRRRWRARPTAAASAGDRAARRARADAAALDRTAAAALERRRRDLDRILATLAAHDPQRTLERGYALARGPGGRAGHERRRGPRTADADGPPARRPRHRPARQRRAARPIARRRGDRDGARDGRRRHRARRATRPADRPRRVTVARPRAVFGGAAGSAVMSTANSSTPPSPMTRTVGDVRGRRCRPRRRRRCGRRAA